MRILADENLPKPIVYALRAGAKDVVLLDFDESEGRTMLTPEEDLLRSRFGLA